MLLHSKRHADTLHKLPHHRARRLHISEQVQAFLLVHARQAEEEIALQSQRQRGFGVGDGLAGFGYIDIEDVFFAHFAGLGSGAEGRDEPVTDVRAMGKIKDWERLCLPYCGYAVLAGGQD